MAGYTANGTWAGNRRVIGTTPSVRDGKPLSKITFDDGTFVYVSRKRPVTTGRIELAAGPVERGYYRKSTPKYRAHHGKWRGERDGTKTETMISRTTAFDLRH